MAASMSLYMRDNPITTAQTDVNSVQTTFSSWDNCMKQNYCKIPAIVLIVIACLIVFSILSCLVRCLCCGLDCCCGCFRCCNACCPSPRNRRSEPKYREDPPQYNPPPYGGYQAQPAPIYAPQQQQPRGAQFASFDASKSQTSGVHPDSLPAAPSWDTAPSKRVLVEDDEMEMNNLHPSQEAHAPLVANAAPRPGMGGYGPSGAQYYDNPARGTGDLGEGYGQAAGFAGATAAGGLMAGRPGPQGYRGFPPTAGSASSSPAPYQQQAGYGQHTGGALQQQPAFPTPAQSQLYSPLQAQNNAGALPAAASPYAPSAASPPPRTQYTASPPPPSYHTTAPGPMPGALQTGPQRARGTGLDDFQRSMSPVGASAYAAGGMPSALMPGGAGQQTAAGAGAYQAYGAQQGRRPADHSWQDV